MKPEYSNEPSLTLLDCATLLLIVLAMALAGSIEHADAQPQDHDTCEYPVDEITAAYIRGYNAGVESDAPKDEED